MNDNELKDLASKSNKDKFNFIQLNLSIQKEVGNDFKNNCEKLGYKPSRVINEVMKRYNEIWKADLESHKKTMEENRD